MRRQGSTNAVAWAALLSVLFVVAALGVYVVTRPAAPVSASGAPASPTLAVGAGPDGSPVPAPEPSTPKKLTPSDVGTEVVQTDAGTITGSVTDQGIRVWRGVPYAAPPVGPLRWHRPEPVTPWSGVRPAVDPSAPCLQYTVESIAARAPVVQPGSSEDCLYLNVARPDDDTTGLPVMVWFHGGGFFRGAAGGVHFDAPGLAGRGIVVVSVDYRLGRLGFFAHPALGGRIANYGLLDEEFALKWVQRNAAAFGGDPARVTIAGSSAGGMSVNAMMSSPSARGLFARAITQSGLGGTPSHTFADAERAGEAAFPGETADQLRALPAEDLLSATFNIFSGDAPIVDQVLPRTVQDTFAAGDEAPVPWIVGTNDDEFDDDAWTLLGWEPVQRRAEIAATAGGAALLAAYRGDSFDKHVLDDQVFTQPALQLATEHASIAPTYRYRFTVPGGAKHGAEQPYVFNTFQEPAAWAQAVVVDDYWQAFIDGDAPAPPGHAAWPQVGPADPTALLELGPDGGTAVRRDPWATRLALVALLPALVASS